MIEILIITAMTLCPCMGTTGDKQEKSRTKTATKYSGPPINKEDPNERIVKGQVVDPYGRPLDQIPIVTYGYHKRETVTGKDGLFSFKLPFEYQHPAGCLIVARDIKRNLAALQGYEGQENCIVIKMHPAVVLEGKICDTRGNGIPNTRLMLYWQLPGCAYGRWEDVPIDKKGRFKISAIPYGRKYSLDISAQGYGRCGIDSINTDIDDAQIQLDPIILQIADQSVGGIVVYSNGKPLANAKVTAGGDGQPWPQTQSDKQGRFTIKGVCTGTVTLNGRHIDGQILTYGEIKVQAGNMDVILVLDKYRLLEAPKPIFESLLGKALPNMTDSGLTEEQIDAVNRQILMCCFDMNQRPSRNCLRQLNERAQELKVKDVVVVAVQSSKIDENTLDKWIKDQNISFPVGIIESYEEETRFNWGVKSLPWLILTDKQHIVQAEGFALNELDEKLKANK